MSDFVPVSSAVENLTSTSNDDSSSSLAQQQLRAKLDCESWINNSFSAAVAASQSYWQFNPCNGGGGDVSGLSPPDSPAGLEQEVAQAFSTLSLPPTPTYSSADMNSGYVDASGKPISSDFNLNYRGAAGGNSFYPPTAPGSMHANSCGGSWNSHSVRSSGFMAGISRSSSCNLGNRTSMSSTVSSDLLSPTELGLPFENNGREPGDMFCPMPPIDGKSSGNAFTFPTVHSAGSGNAGGRPPRLLPSQRLGLTSTLNKQRLEKRPQYNFCVFCKNNGEDEKFYMTHTLKDDHGMVRCPVLFSYICPICQATGKVAHTIRYCPKNKEDKYHDQMSMAPITVLKEMRTSTGKSRPGNDPASAGLQPLEALMCPAAGAPGARPILGQGSNGGGVFGSGRRLPAPPTPMTGDLYNHPGRFQ